MCAPQVIMMTNCLWLIEYSAAVHTRYYCAPVADRTSLLAAMRSNMFFFFGCETRYISDCMYLY